MSFTLLPVAVIARSNVTLVGAPDEAQAVDEGVQTNDADTSYFALNAQGSLCELKVADPPGPTAGLKPAVWAAVRSQGDVPLDPQFQPSWSTIKLQVICGTTGRVIELGEFVVSFETYNVLVAGFKNDMSAPEWIGMHVRATYTGGNLVTPHIRVSAIELRAVDPPDLSTPATVGVSPACFGYGRTSIAFPLSGR